MAWYQSLLLVAEDVMVMACLLTAWTELIGSPRRVASSSLTETAERLFGFVGCSSRFGHFTVGDCPARALSAEYRLWTETSWMQTPSDQI